MRRPRRIKRIQLRVDELLHAEVMEIARGKGKTMSSLIEEYLFQLVKSHKPRRDDLGIEQL